MTEKGLGEEANELITVCQWIHRAMIQGTHRLAEVSVDLTTEDMELDRTGQK